MRTRVDDASGQRLTGEREVISTPSVEFEFERGDACETLRRLRAPHESQDDREMLARVESKLFGRPARPIRMGRYAVLDRLGAGNLGVVYRGHDSELDREVAIKVLRGCRGRADDLLREVTAVAHLSHPNVAEVYDVGMLTADRTLGRARGAPFVVMELVHGCNLDQWLVESPRSTAEILDVFLQAGRGLAAAHAVGIVHGDFKPSNVIIGDDGRVRVVDFGLARSGDPGSQASTLPERKRADRERSEPERAVTGSHTEDVGTPPYSLYMAPEQLRGERGTALVDQYAFCIALLEALSGRVPFAGDTVAELAVAKQRRPRWPRSSRFVGWTLERAILRGLEPEPEARHDSMETLLAGLAGNRRSRQRMGVAVAAAGLSAALLAVRWAGFEPTPVDRCDEVATAVAEAWSDEHRDAMQTAAGSSAWFGGVDAALDRHQRALQAELNRHCGTTEPSSATALVCLERRAIELAAAVELIVGGEVDPNRDAALVVTSLSPAQACETSTGGESDPPALELVWALARARVRLAAGRIDAAEAALSAWPGPGEGTDPRLHGELLVLRGELDARRSEFDAARQWHEQAFYLASVGGIDAIAVDAAVRLSVLPGPSGSNFSVARDWLRRAQAALDRLPQDPRRRALLHDAHGQVLARDGRHEAAASHFAQAVSEAEHVTVDAVERAVYLQHLGESLQARERHDEARRHYERAVRELQPVLGEQDPSLLPVLERLGTSWSTTGDHERAATAFRSALAIAAASLGPEDPTAQSLAVEIAMTHVGRGEFDVAAPMLVQVLDTLRPRRDATPRAWMRAEYGLGLAYLGSGQLQRASASIERALGAGEVQLQPSDPLLADLLEVMGRIHLESDAAGRAARALDRSLTIRLGHGASPVALASTRFWLARARWDEGRDPNAAIAAAEQAMAELELAGASAEPLRGQVQDWLQTRRGR